MMISNICFYVDSYVNLMHCSEVTKQGPHTVNQQILVAIKFGVSQNKVIWRLLNLASPCLCDAVYDQRNLHMLALQILAKTNNSPNLPNIIARQILLIYST